MTKRQELIVFFALIVSLCMNVSAHESTRLAHERSLRAIKPKKAALNKPIAQQCKKEHCHLTIKLIDADTGQRVSGLVQAQGSDGEIILLDETLNRGFNLPAKHGSRKWNCIVGDGKVTAPKHKITLKAIKGLATEITETTIDLSGLDEAVVTMKLKRIWNAKSKGWRNGNTHLHLQRMTREQADNYLKTITEVDGLELVFVSYLVRPSADHLYISNTYTQSDLEKLGDDDTIFGYGEEQRNDMAGVAGYGHVMYLNIKRLVHPVSIGPRIMDEGYDYPSIRKGIKVMRGDGATVIWCHNAYGMEDVPNWIDGIIDAQNIFDGGNKGGYEDTYYRYMNLGIKAPFSTGTDWHVFDFSRAYTKVSGKLSVENWLEALEAGKSFITNGPFFEFEVQGRDIGETIKLDKSGKLKVKGKAIGRIDFEKLELVFNGQVVHTLCSKKVGGHYEAEMEYDLNVTEPGWAAIRINAGDKNNDMGKPLFGHTSAVYIELAGKKVFKRETAKLLIEDMKKSIEVIKEHSKFADDTQRENVLDIYRNGIGTMESRIQQ